MLNNEDIRYIAHFVVETNTPLAIGSGEKGLTVDRLIVRDANGLPYIPGTSLAGVVRHEITEELLEDVVNDIFGHQDNENKGQGSRINFSSAVLVSGDGKQKALEGLHNINLKEGYYSYFNRLPERDHVRITHRGSADTEGHGKFDEELVHKGVRFMFEIELEGKEADKENWVKILNILHNPSFRIGAGTRKGFGALKIVECRTKEIDLKKSISDYLSITSSLNKEVNNWSEFKSNAEHLDKKFYHYVLNVEPENFYIFGAGIGDEDVDMAPKKEKYFEWSNGKPKLTEANVLIPGTSVKGALAHRVAYYYNKSKKITIESNVAKFDSVKEDVIIASLTKLKELENSIKSIVEEMNARVETKSMDIEMLKELKEGLVVKKSELSNHIIELNKLNIEESIDISYNWKMYLQDLEDMKKQLAKTKPNVSELNEGVRQLFGYAKNSKESDSIFSEGLRGRVIISDVYLDKSKADVSEKVFDHVAIDRFTGGGIEGALYQEKAVSSSGFTMDIFVEKNAFDNKMIKESFENALEDLVSGNIQLGGNTGKGHGAFVGSYKLLNAE